MTRGGSPAIRIERTEVRPFFLGLIGFDHLQLVFDHGSPLQDDWYVIEGVRDPGPRGPTLGVQGSDGHLTLARANAASGDALEALLGTPRSRGSRILASGQDAEDLWPLLAGWAAQIDRMRLPYVAFGLPGSEEATCNSSTLIGTLLYRLDFDIAASMPPGTRLVPGVERRIGYHDRSEVGVAPGGRTCQTSVV